MGPDARAGGAPVDGGGLAGGGHHGAVQLQGAPPGELRAELVRLVEPRALEARLHQGQHLPAAEAPVSVTAPSQGPATPISMMVD